ncbi:MAG: helicase-exonuclease AddAB subunit AddB [Eubacterium sp.]|nr:helicase-exonuclease AddAB subunit AddB [Eubacterium sp.]
MSLEFVAGRSGAGKSYQVYREIIRESMEEPERQFLVIVPEQFTMQTQKEIVQMHPRKGMMNLDVLSFNRLAWRVFEKVGGNTLPVLDDLGKSLITQRVIGTEQKKLRVLGRTLSRQGAAEEMKSLISELLQYRVEESDLDRWIEESGEKKQNRLAMKLTDIRTVYHGFRTFLADHYLTAEEVPGVLCDVIGKSDLVKGSRIVLDGFTGFTPVQLEVVRELLRLADRVTVVLTADTPENLYGSRNIHRLFHMSCETYRKVSALAEETRTEIRPVKWVDPGDKSRFANSPELQFMEKNLFRYCRDGYHGKKEDGHQIHITEAADPEQEIRAAAGQICRLVREKGYHYRDFAVVTGDLDTYGREAVRIFRSAQIPCFLDQKKKVMSNQMVEFIRAAVDMIRNNYSYDSVFRYLHSGLSLLGEEEIQNLEDYCLALGIHGRKKFEEAWTRTSRSMKPDMLLFYNELREKFARETQALHDGLHERNATVRRRTGLLYEFLVRQDVQNRMRKRADSFREMGDASSAREYDRIFEQVMGMFDRLVEVLGDEKMKLSDYQEILDAGFGEMSIGLIPPGEDQVLVGDIERTRLKKIRVMFFVGINEGIIPKPIPAGGILSEPDREKLSDQKAELSPTSREQMYRQRFYLYLAMTKASDALWLSWSRSGSGGESLLPSYLVGTIRRMFPDVPALVQEELENKDTTLRMETRDGQMEYLLEELQQMPERMPSGASVELLRRMLRDPEGKRRAEALLEAVRARNPEKGLGYLLAEKLYGKELLNSVTRLEEMASCAFRHFLDYGLRLKERDEYVFTPADFGTVMHDSLQVFSETLARKGLDWGSLPDGERDRIADESLTRVTDGYNNRILFSTKRNEYMMKRLREILRRTVWALQQQVKKGRFRPSDFEFDFGDDLSAVHFRLDHGASMRLIGRIDRLDICETKNARYIKIIDYKTGSTKLDLEDMYYGLQLQLAVYMNAALEADQRKHPGSRTEPAGIFYYHIEDPVIEEEKASTETERLEEILKQLRPQGLCRSEMEVLKLLDQTLEKGVTSDVIPAGVKKDGSLTKSSQTESLENFGRIRDYTNRKVKDLGNRIVQGHIKADPYVREGKDRNACTFCPYQGICGFDRRIPGFEYRRLPKLKREDILEAIGKSEKEDS